MPPENTAVAARVWRCAERCCCKVQNGIRRSPRSGTRHAVQCMTCLHAIPKPFLRLRYDYGASNATWPVRSEALSTAAAEQAREWYHCMGTCLRSAVRLGMC
eukprot:TRINITY_DN2580_c0_g1_i1.p2 TRINITY_DN2580_c0_g1~~TRINITY_DN2580_c0_g1_i1.p2  ORF type:complete len:102 (-),score=7.98 TRINITY_DN2580_c0_g1_i1:711-1016(-)